MNLWKTQPNLWKTQIWPNGPKISARRTKTDFKDQGGQQVKYLRETQQRKKVKIQSSNWNCPKRYFQIKTIPSSKIEGVVGAEFPEPPTSRFLTSSWIGTQVLDIINKYKNRKRENVSLQVEKQNKQKKEPSGTILSQVGFECKYSKYSTNKKKENTRNTKTKEEEYFFTYSTNTEHKKSYQQLLYLKLDCNASTPYNQQIKER